MRFAQRAQEALGNAIAVVNIIRTALAIDNDVEALVDDALLGDIGDDEYEASEVWTIAGVQSRPKDGDETTGYAKAIRIQLGDVVYVLGTHDPRHVEACEEGELLLHALGNDGATRALARFKPDGEVIIEGTNIKVGNGTNYPIAIGDAVESILNALAKSTPTATMDGGLSLITAIVTKLNADGFTLSSTPAPANGATGDFESGKHTVEV